MPRASLWSYAKTISPFLASKFQFLDSDSNTNLVNERVTRNNNKVHKMDIKHLLSAQPEATPRGEQKQASRKDEAVVPDAPLAGQKRSAATLEENPDQTIRDDAKVTASNEQPPPKRPRTEPVSYELVPAHMLDPTEYCISDHPGIISSIQRARAAGIYTGFGSRVVVKYDPPEGRGAIAPPSTRPERHTPRPVPTHVLVGASHSESQEPYEYAQTTKLRDQPTLAELEEQRASAGNGGVSGQSVATQGRGYSISVGPKKSGTPARDAGEGGFTGDTYPYSLPDHLFFETINRGSSRSDQQQEREQEQDYSSESGSSSSREEFGRRIGKYRLKNAFPKRKVFRRMRTWAGRTRKVDIRRSSTGSILTPGPMLSRPGRRTLRTSIGGVTPARASSSASVVAAHDIPLPSIEDGSGGQPIETTAPPSVPVPQEGRVRPKRQAAVKADATRREYLASTARATAAKKSAAPKKATAKATEAIAQTIPEEEEIEDDGDESGDYSDDPDEVPEPAAKSTRATSRKAAAPKGTSKAPRQAAAKPAKKAASKPAAKKASSTAKKGAKK